MLTHNPDNNFVGGCSKHPGQSFLNCYYCKLDSNKVGQEPKKKVKKKPSGILKDLLELERHYMYSSDEECFPVKHKKGAYVEWSDIEEIIKKYS